MREKTLQSDGTPQHFPELHEAISSGFTDHFIFRPDHTLLCLSDSLKVYELDDVTISIVSCTSVPATLYLINTKDGLYNGVAVEYWEHY